MLVTKTAAAVDYAGGGLRSWMSAPGGCVVVALPLLPDWVVVWKSRSVAVSVTDIAGLRGFPVQSIPWPKLVLLGFDDLASINIWPVALSSWAMSCSTAGNFLCVVRTMT